jgi:hypothetical protein
MMKASNNAVCNEKGKLKIQATYGRVVEAVA